MLTNIIGNRSPSIPLWPLEKNGHRYRENI
jgi:hypothetical protein